MPPRKIVDRKLLMSRKLSLNQRYSDTPKKATPSRTRRNIITSSGIMNEVSALSESCDRHSSVNTNDVSSTIDFTDILKTTWKVFKVSPLYNFNERSLKTYARKLKEEVAAFNYNNEDVKYDCSFQFQKLPLLGKLYEIIKVTLSANNNKYNGFFISCYENNLKKKVSNFKSFPVLLVKGHGKILQQVHNTICKFFDCDINPARFSFKALIEFFASLSEMCIKDVPDLTFEAVILHYKIPGCPQSDSIQAALSLAAASTAFAVYNSQLGCALTKTQIITHYYDRIIKHLLNVYKVDLFYAELNKVIFPGFAVSSEGWVKFSSEDIFSRTLPIIEEYLELPLCY